MQPTNAPSAVGAAYTAPTGLDFILAWDATTMSRLRRCGGRARHSVRAADARTLANDGSLATLAAGRGLPALPATTNKTNPNEICRNRRMNRPTTNKPKPQTENRNRK